MNSSTAQPSEAALHAVDYWQVVKNRYGIILLTLLLVFMTAAVITYVMPKKYESVATIEVKPKNAGVSPLGESFIDSFGANRMTAQFFGTEFEKIRSSNSLSKVVDKLELVSKWGVDKQNAIQMLKSIVQTQNLRGTDLITIRVRHTSKEDARDVTSEVAKAYKEYRAEIEEGDADKKLIELNKAVRAQEDKVEERRKVLATIVRTRKIIYTGEEAFFGQGKADDGGAQDAQQTFNNLQTEKMQLESQINSLLKYDSEELLRYASALDLPENIIRNLYPLYLQAQRELNDLRINGLGSRHPTLLAAESQISGMKKNLDEGVVNLRATLQVQLAMASDRLKNVEVRKNETRDEAIKTGLGAQDYMDAKRDYETDQKLLETMRLNQISVSIIARMPDDSIVFHEEAQISDNPVSPNVTLNLVLGAVVGLIFGVGIAFFLEYLDTSVKSLEDVERYLQVPVLAVIPKDVGILHKQSGMSPDAEAYRILRTNIEFNRKNPEDNAITVVSGGAGEGKSTTLVNLAYICAQGGYTTLMIDADLRRPRLHTFFDINNSVGLTNYLTTELMLEDVILQTPVDNLYFMPSGILPADAAGILNSRRMSELIQDVKQRFDLVLVDSPPILGVSDASVLASEVDLTMIVVQHRKLPRNMLLRVKQAVENVGGNVIGVVLNNVDVRSDSQYQYYTSYYTYYAPAESQVGPPVGSTSAAPRANPAGKSGESELY